MSDLPRNVRVPHVAAHRARGRPRRVLVPRPDGVIEVREPWPDGAHLAVVEGDAAVKQKAVKRRRPAAAAERFRQQHLKALDLVEFNQRAEGWFVVWLAEKIRGTRYEGVELGWVVKNAAYELDVSVETVKRYLAKHTADRAEFFCDGKLVRLRDG